MRVLEPPTSTYCTIEEIDDEDLPMSLALPTSSHSLTTMPPDTSESQETEIIDLFSSSSSSNKSSSNSPNNRGQESQDFGSQTWQGQPASSIATSHTESFKSGDESGAAGLNGFRHNFTEDDVKSFVQASFLLKPPEDLELEAVASSPCTSVVALPFPAPLSPPPSAPAPQWRASVICSTFTKVPKCIEIGPAPTLSLPQAQPQPPAEVPELRLVSVNQNRERLLQDFCELVLQLDLSTVSPEYIGLPKPSGSCQALVTTTGTTALATLPTNRNNVCSTVALANDPLDFFVYSESELQDSYSDCTFYIQSLEDNFGHLPTAEEFAVRIISPSGKFCRLELEEEGDMDESASPTTRHSCSFWSTEPGIYVIEVRLRTTGHIGGSPLGIKIARPYDSPVIRIHDRMEVICTDQPRPRIREAWGLAYNPLRNELYVADRKFCEITTRSITGETDSKFGGKDPAGQGLPESLCTPTGLAFDSVWNRIIVVDRGNHRVCFFTPSGRFLGSFGQMGHQKSEFLFPWGVAISPNGEKIAVTDTDNGRIQVFDHNGVFIAMSKSVIDSGGRDYFGNLKGIAFDHSGENVYFTDADYNRIYEMSVDSTITKCVKISPDNLLLHPHGIAVDSVGNLIVCDPGHNCVRVFTQNGKLLHTKSGLGDNYLEDGPLGVCIVGDGSVIVVNKNEQLCVF